LLKASSRLHLRDNLSVHFCVGHLLDHRVGKL
jgi:hypothetical protein